MADTRGSRVGLDVVELVDEHSPIAIARPEVVAHLNPADHRSITLAAKRLSEYDAVILQHEYGIWGPKMGWPIVELIERLDTPVITSLHTLLPNPTPTQNRIVNILTARSEITVVPTQAALQLLQTLYAGDLGAVTVIPHGTKPVHRSVARLRRPMDFDGVRPRLVTWGLIGPGKGLEWSLRAASQLGARYPDLRYTIAGRTHPNVVAHEGERYRRHLQGLVANLGLELHVEFRDSYLSDRDLRDLLLGATIVVLPYDSMEQIVSGVLVEAVAANVPVVATSFPHALELARESAVAAVPHKSPEAMARAISRLLDQPAVRARMTSAQQRLGPDLEWSSVASQYEHLIAYAIKGSVAKRHVSPAS